LEKLPQNEAGRKTYATTSSSTPSSFNLNTMLSLFHSFRPLLLSYKVLLGTFLFLLQTRLANAIVDLSQPWILSANYNKNELYCTLQAAMGNNIVGYLVIQEGEVVAEGYAKNTTASDLYPAFSATKSWSSMIMGLLFDAGKLQLDTTLGQVFADDSIWLDIIDAEAKKTLTMEELLTFTSGLSEIYEISVAMTLQDTLTGVLNTTSFNPEQRGIYEYVQTNHILARIINQVSGKTPLEVATESGAFAALGLKADVDYTWETFGGVEGSAYGLHINPRTLAKLGLLYLQEGYAKLGVPPVVSSEWVSWSTTNQLAPGVVPTNNPLYNGYGYQWYTNDDGSFAAVGGGGQMAVVYPDDEIVVVVMTSFDQSTIREATLESARFVREASVNFDDIVQEGSCIQDEDEAPFCFPGESSVIVQNGSSVHKIKLADLKIGDKVKVGNEKFEPVYSFGHHHPLPVLSYLHIKFANGESLKVSRDHFVFSNSANSFIQAKHLCVGDEVITSTGGTTLVREIVKTKMKGAYAPFSPSGKLIVDNIVVSSFAASANQEDTVKILGGLLEFSHHDLAHAFEFPHRLACHYTSFLCVAETYDGNGVSSWVAGPLKFFRWIYRQPSIIRELVLCVAVSLLVAFQVLEVIFVPSKGILPLAIAGAVMLLRRLLAKPK
jgi:CubicO group peptidase (beta-lactamase class C family)